MFHVTLIHPRVMKQVPRPGDNQGSLENEPIYVDLLPSE